MVGGAERALDAYRSKGGRDAGVDCVWMRTAAAGHDACAGVEAWTNGASAPKDDGFPLHPNAAGMEAVATEIRSRLAG